MSALLKGCALDVYDRLSVDDAADYEKLKEALLKNFDMTERADIYERPEKSETFIQFSSRLRSYVNKWLKMAKIEESYEAVCDFFARDQFLDSCSRELYVHLKPKSLKNLEEMANPLCICVHSVALRPFKIFSSKHDQESCKEQES